MYAFDKYHFHKTHVTEQDELTQLDIKFTTTVKYILYNMSIYCH